MKTDYSLDDPRLRKAMLKAFDGKCFYSGQEVTSENMVIDHIVPKSKGGEDSILNYALTTKSLNSKKSDTIDKEGVAPVLYLIKMVYVPKLLELLERKPTIKRRMKRVTMYVDSEEWGDVQRTTLELSFKRGEQVSAGNYLVDLHKANLEYQDSAKPAQPEKFESHKPISEEDIRKDVVIDRDLRDGKHPYSEPVVEEPDPVEKVEAEIKKIMEKKADSDDFFNPGPKGKDGKK